MNRYKDVRFFDDERMTMTEGGCFRIRSDSFTWKGNRSGGWIIVCDQMPDVDPAHDPA